ncbi:MAG: P-loop NTPase fold protein, partial [Phycisphaeraceae bacterium]
MTLLTEPRLVPVTIGLDGDWGSGKSSLLKMAAARLDAEDKYVAVSFSPWMHEDYDDIKIALITSVLRALRDAAPVEAAPRINAIMRVVRELAKVARFGKGLIPMGVTAAAVSQGVDTAQAGALGTAAGQVAGHAIDALTKAETADVAEDLDRSMLVAEFRDQFRELMGELEAEVAGVVVFIDDVDRCLPEAVVDTFEAIRLFSDIEGTAFVIAAHRSMVEAAIELRPTVRFRLHDT